MRRHVSPSGRTSLGAVFRSCAEGPRTKGGGLRSCSARGLGGSRVGLTRTGRGGSGEAPEGPKGRGRALTPDGFAVLQGYHLYVQDLVECM